MKNEYKSAKNAFFAIIDANPEASDGRRDGTNMGRNGQKFQTSPNIDFCQIFKKMNFFTF